MYKLIAAGVILLIAVIFFIIVNPLVSIGAGERGIVLTWGAPSGQVMQPGLNWRTPVAQSVVQVDVQTQKIETPVNAASKDLQSVSATVALNYHLDPLKLIELYQKIGLDFENRIIAPTIQEAVKASTAKFTAEELITKRSEVKEQTRMIINERLAKDHIIVEDLSIVNFDFSESFNNAIEAKVTAEQDALGAKNKLEQVKFEAQQQIETAKANAEAIKIQASAVNAQGGADYVKLQWILKWNGQQPNYMMGNSVPLIQIPN